MSLEVNSQMLFTNLTPAEAKELQNEVEKILLNGEIKWNSPFFTEWAKTMQFTDANKLIVYSTVYPARALLSILKFTNR